jgi:glycosyltransferase involved in cell wall biosynthesis
MHNKKPPPHSGRKRLCFVATLEMTVRVFLIEHLRALGRDYDITVIVKTAEPDFLAVRGVDARVIVVPIERKVAPLRDLATLVRLYMIFRHERFDVVHSVMPKSGLLSMVAACLARIPRRVHTFTGQVWATRKGAARMALKTLDKILVLCATHVLVDSPSQRAFLVKEGVVPGAKAMVLGQGSICGVDTERFRPNEVVRTRIRSELAVSESEVLILFLGRLNRDKGLMDLAGAFRLVRKSHRNVRLLVVGPDEEGMREEMERLCGSDATGLSFRDFADAPEDYMAASDVLCLPSYREGFGIVIIEAAAAGIPSVGSRIYGISDTIDDGVTGLLFEPGDVDDLAKKLGVLLENRPLRERMGAEARKKVAAIFSRDILTGAMVEYYRHVLAG